MTQTLRFISFGCHNLTGGSSLRDSIRLIHCAMDHGIAQFDVAPSYGLGTAESVLGTAIENRSIKAEITTKFGIEPPRFGRFLAWGRAPYRYLRRLVGRAPAPVFNNLAIGEASRLGLLKSLERSLRALNIDRVHTLLTHEFIDRTRIRDHLNDLKFARRLEMLQWFGCSGEREAVVQAVGAFGYLAQVVQVSVNDCETFSTHPNVRLFGVVRVLAPQIAHQAGFDERYRDQLFSALVGVKSAQECFALGAIAAARTLFPQSTLVVTTSNEARIGDIVRFLGDRTLLDWGATHRAIHNRMLVDRARD
jgi:hypothetical protein